MTSGTYFCLNCRSVGKKTKISQKISHVLITVWGLQVKQSNQNEIIATVTEMLPPLNAGCRSAPKRKIENLNK